METIVTLKTSHKGGIKSISFSLDGSKLISVGMDRNFSIQVFHWK